MMNKQKGCRIAAAVLAGLLLLSAFAIQLAGGRGPLPDWQQLRAALGVPLRTEESAPKPASGSTAVYVLDVGQGDAVLICQDGVYCLIDTGPAEAEEALLYDLHTLDVESLDYLVLTHPHADHTGNAGRCFPISRSNSFCCRCGSRVPMIPPTGPDSWLNLPQKTALS